MTKHFKFSLLILFSLVFFYSCQQEENSLPSKGIVSFSLAQKDRNNGRDKETTIPAFVLLTIVDSKGNARENVKLPLYSLGQGYISENLELQTGIYQLTQFAVLDASYKIIYATPVEGSDLANLVTEPLPIQFNVTQEGTQVIPQVLAVMEDDQPESFGLASFGFEIVDITPDLNISLHYPEMISYDSARIVFKNSSSEIMRKLNLDNVGHIATVSIIDIPVGDWNVSASFYNTIAEIDVITEKMGVADLRITSTATDLISNETFVYIKDKNDPINKSFIWADYHYCHIYNNSFNKVLGFVRLPANPRNPFIEISIFSAESSWYYVEKLFYNVGYFGFPDLQFIYKTGTFIDSPDPVTGHFIDPAFGSLPSTIDANFAECLILGNDFTFYHTWDFGVPNGRIRSRSTLMNRTAVHEKKIH